MPIFLCDIFPSDYLKNIFDIDTLFVFHIKRETYDFREAKQY